MTAVAEDRSARTPPRPLIRTFWMLHRAAYRVTGGRFGLSKPETGSRFGTMRLATVGRRSGKPRLAIVGYYEDGPNLVTLAMNGWGQAEPAWWLNLQANPETTVGLADGPRAVRARAATGAERERLWAKFQDYPGWGDDLKGLADRRPSETAVVVLEPRGVEGRAREAATTPDTEPDAGAGRAAQATSTAPAARPAGRRMRLRHVLILPGLAIAIFAGTQADHHGLGLVPLLAFSIIPDLTRLLGIGQPHAQGQLARRAVPLFNLLHHPGPPLAMLVLAAVGVLSPFWLVGSLAWLGHIVIGLGVGDRLRTRDGFLRSHWVVDLPAARSSGLELPAESRA